MSLMQWVNIRYKWIGSRLMAQDLCGESFTWNLTMMEYSYVRFSNACTLASSQRGDVDVTLKHAILGGSTLILFHWWKTISSCQHAKQSTLVCIPKNNLHLVLKLESAETLSTGYIPRVVVEKLKRGNTVCKEGDEIFDALHRLHRCHRWDR